MSLMGLGSGIDFRNPRRGLNGGGDARLPTLAERRSRLRRVGSTGAALGGRYLRAGDQSRRSGDARPGLHVEAKLRVDERARMGFEVVGPVLDGRALPWQQALRQPQVTRADQADATVDLFHVCRAGLIDAERSHSHHRPI